VLGWWGTRIIAAEASRMFANFSIDPTLSGRSIEVLAGLVISVVAVLVGVPAWQARRSGALVNLRESGRGIVGNSTRSQKTLIGAQVAFTLALVTVSGVFASSFDRLEHMPLGLRAEGVAEAMLSPLPGGYDFQNPKAYYAILLQRVESLPGVASASLSSFALYWQRLTPELVRDGANARAVRAQTIRISDGYFRTIGVRLLTGEDFGRDRTGLEAIVSKSVASQLGGAAGGYILIGDAGAAKRYRVIGVAPTIRTSMADARDSSPLAVYLNFWEDSKEQRYPVLVVQGTRGTPPDVRALGPAVQSLGREFVEEYRTLEELRDESITEESHPGISL